MRRRPTTPDIDGDGIPLAATFRALANGDRLAILDAMQEQEAAGSGPLTISEIAKLVELDRFATSRHLSLLREARLIDGWSVGAGVRHQLAVDAFEILEDWLISFLGAGVR